MARWKSQRTLPWVAVALALGAASCSEHAERSASTATPTAVLAPVPAPDGLAGEVRIERPGEVWSRARSTIGGALVTLPRSYGGLVIHVLGMPLGVVGEFDDTRPVVGAVHVASGEPRSGGDPGDVSSSAAPAWAVALALHDPKRFLGQLRLGAADRFVAEPPSAAGVTLLTRTTKGKSWGWLPAATLAVVDRHLVVASAPDAIAALGLYLTRTSAPRRADDFFSPERIAPAQRAPDSPPISVRLEASRLRPQLEGFVGRWLGELSGSASTPLAGLLDPSELRQAAGNALEGVGTVQAVFEVEADSLRLRATARLEGDASSRQAHSGVDVPRLLEIPTDAVAVVGWSESPTERAQAAEQTTQALLTWIGRVTPDVEPRAANALENVAAGRGDWTAVGLRCTGVGLTGFASGPVADASKLDQGLRALLDLRRHPTVARRLKAAGLRVTPRTIRVPNWPKDLVGVRLRANAQPARTAAGSAGHEPPAEPSAVGGPGGLRLDPIEMLATVGADRYVLTAGLEPAETIRLLLQPKEGETLRSQTRWLTPSADGGSGEAPSPWAVLATDPIGFARCLGGSPSGDWSRRIIAAVGPGAAPDLAWVEIEIGAGLPAALGANSPAEPRSP